jgi:Na+/proline symporter
MANRIRRVRKNLQQAMVLAWTASPRLLMKFTLLGIFNAIMPPISVYLSARLVNVAEAAIFAELKENLKGRIGIVISHRFSTVRIADRIAVIADGHVTELGSHEELLKAGGRYAELFELQAAGYR